MPIILTWLVTAFQWIAAFFVARWIAHKIFWITVLTVGLPWVLKDGVQWFWKAGEEYRTHILQFIDTHLATALGQAGFQTTISIYGVAAYMAQEMGFLDYVSIVITGWSICWGLKLIGKIF